MSRLQLQVYVADIRLSMVNVWREIPRTGRTELEARPVRELRNMIIYIMYGETTARGWPGHT